MTFNQQRIGGHTKRAHRHRYPVVNGFYECGHIYNAELARRGKLAARKGKAIQKTRIEGLGGTNLLGNNENLDGRSPLFAFESKAGNSEFPSRAWRYLRGIPHNGQQIQVLIITDTPGPGRRARSVVVIDYDDWKALHGE
jgi:hypothetical protein